MKDNVIGIMGIGYIKSCELAEELVNTKTIGNTKKIKWDNRGGKKFKNNCSYTYWNKWFSYFKYKRKRCYTSKLL